MLPYPELDKTTPDISQCTEGAKQAKTQPPKGGELIKLDLLQFNERGGRASVELDSCVELGLL